MPRCLCLKTSLRFVVVLIVFISADRHPTGALETCYITFINLPLLEAAVVAVAVFVAVVTAVVGILRRLMEIDLW